MENSFESAKFVNDVVFENIANSISPESISKENKELIDSFVDILSEISPISVNILDTFYTGNKNENLKELQNTFSEIYLNNFISIWNRAKNDYVLMNRLKSILKKYEQNGYDDFINSNVSFFENIDELKKTERYILGKNFKEKKGTKTALEYAYKTIWKANIEGPLKTNYDFNMIENECTGGNLTRGFYICSSLTNPCTYEPDGTSGTSKLIGTFTIENDPDKVDNSTCSPFSYQIEGNMIEALFNAVVVPLAHPVGFRYIYEKVTNTNFEDYFNIEYYYTADKVSVLSLCYNNDCSEVTEDIYSSKNGSNITNSNLKNIKTGKFYSGTFKDYSYEKYIFDNEDYLISYTKADDSGDIERIIHYNKNIGNDYNFNKTNFINATKPILVETFKIDNDIYLCVGLYNTLSSFYIYKWDGYKFNLFQEIENTGQVFGIEKIEISGNHFIFVNVRNFSNNYNTSSKLLYFNGTEFVIDQEIDTKGSIDSKFFEIDNEFYLFIGNNYDGFTRILTSKLYKWNGNEFIEYQNFQTNGAYKFDFTEINNNKYLFITNFNNDITYTLDSILYKWNGNEFIEYQNFQTNGATDVKFIKIYNDNFLVIGNSKNDETCELYSNVYKFDGEFFINFQDISTNNCTDIEFIKIDNEFYLTFINNGCQEHEIESIVYRWDNTKFREKFKLSTNGGRNVTFFNDENYYMVIPNEYGDIIDIYEYSDIKKYEIAKEYPNTFHSSINIDNLSLPMPIYSTKDELSFWNNEEEWEDTFLSLFKLEPAIIGDIYIANTEINGEISEEENGGFIIGDWENYYNTLENPNGENIGGFKIPYGNPSTRYMKDRMFIETFPNISDWNSCMITEGFDNPDEWTMETGWNIIESVSNIAVCDGSQTGFSYLYKELDIKPENNHYIRVMFELESENLNEYLMLDIVNSIFADYKDIQNNDINISENYYENTGLEFSLTSDVYTSDLEVYMYVYTQIVTAIDVKLVVNDIDIEEKRVNLEIGYNDLSLIFNNINNLNDGDIVKIMVKEWEDNSNILIIKNSEKNSYIKMFVNEMDSIVFDKNGTNEYIEKFKNQSGVLRFRASSNFVGNINNLKVTYK